MLTDIRPYLAALSRLNLLVRNDPHWSVEEQLAGVQLPTHLGRILQVLAVGYIGARSPQAKGRIERLWATLQDRLVSELRLRDVRTVEAAQAYLPDFIADFNRRFGKPPAQPATVWRRPPRDLALILGCGYRRVVARDNTIRLGPRLVQLRGRRSFAGLTVEVRTDALPGALLRPQAAPGAESGSPSPSPRLPACAGHSACHASPRTRTLAAGRYPLIRGSGIWTATSGCTNFEPGGPLHVAVTEDLITDQRQ